IELVEMQHATPLLLIAIEAGAHVAGTLAERDAVGGAGGVHAGDCPQRAEHARVEVGAVAAVTAAEHERAQRVFIHAAVDAHQVQAAGHQEEGVAQHRAGQRDLEHDQGRGDAVTTERGEDRFDVHGPSQSDLICNAGAIRLARAAGSIPASRLAATAIAKVAANIERSIRTRSAYSTGWRRTAQSPSRVSSRPNAPPSRPISAASVRHCAKT